MSPLISTAALAERLAGERSALRLFDATVHLRPAQPGPYRIEGGRADYEAAHIPSAVFIKKRRVPSSDTYFDSTVRTEGVAIPPSFSRNAFGRSVISLNDRRRRA